MTLTLRDYVLSRAAPSSSRVEADLTRLAQKMADGDEAAFAQYSRAEARLEHAGGWTWRDRATAMVRGLGFDDDADLDRQLKTFSGGELTRASLARALAGDPDLLLLDEPTNHLDIESLEWLEKTLVALDTAIVLVAHDRWFLEAVGTGVLELEAGRSRYFPGTWTQWRTEQAAREIAMGRAIDKQQAEIARLERFVERFRAKATKAKQAQSRVKRLDKIERIERDPRDREGLKFDFKAPERSGRVVFELHRRARRGRREPAEGAARRRRAVARARRARDARRAQRRRQDDAHRHARGRAAARARQALDRPQREDRAPLAARGRPRQGAGRQREQGRRGVRRAHGADAEQGARAARALPLQRRGGREAAGRAVSGGERRRLSLAILVASGANVLILDEPTNHLDIESREALEDALLAFEGTLLLVSHDRALLEAVGTRTVAVDDGKLRSYEGGWQEYVRVREERRLAARARRARRRGCREGDRGRRAGRAARPARRLPRRARRARQAKAPKAKPRPRRPRRSARARSSRRRRPKALPAAPNGNGNGVAAGAAVEERAPAHPRARARDRAAPRRRWPRSKTELAQPDAWSTPERSKESTARHAAAKREVEEAFARWEAAVAVASPA